MLTEKNKKVGKFLKKTTLKELIFGNVVGCRSAKVNSIKDILQDFAKIISYPFIIFFKI